MQSETRANPSDVLQAAEKLLGQCADIVGVLSDAQYAKLSEAMPGGSVGKHLRHTLDHYSAIGEAIDGGAPVEYDRRVRGGPIETSTRAAMESIASLRAGLEGLAAELARPVSVRVMLDGDGACAELHSTVGREVAFATHHAVHHLAMIRVICAEMGVEVGSETGVAPSTVHHERHTAAREG